MNKAHLTVGNRNPFLLIPFIALSLLIATTAGWLRLGWNIPVSINAGEHGAMMVGCFLGSLIALERAVVIKKPWAYFATLFGGLSILFFLFQLSMVAYVLLTVASLCYITMLLYLYKKHPETHMLVMIVGAICWLIGNLILLIYQLYPLVSGWWFGFLLLTIAGERLELSRFLPQSKFKHYTLIFALGIFLVGLVLPFHGTGRYIVGIGLIAIAIWLFRFDIARISVKKTGLTRYVATALLCGYFWLLVCGGMAIYSDFYYDAVLHSFFLGFVFSMIFAHGPIILPGVFKISIKPYHPILYVWLVILQVSLITRILGSIFILNELRKWSGMLNGLVIFAYLLSLVVIVIRHNLKKPSNLDAIKEKHAA